MSILVLLIAAVHAIPVLLAARITKSRKAVTRVAQITSIVAIVTGAIVFTIVDLLAIWIAWKWVVSRLPEPEPNLHQVQIQSPQNGTGMSRILPEPAQPRLALQAQNRLHAEGASRNGLPSGAILNGVYTVEEELGHGGVGIV